MSLELPWAIFGISGSWRAQTRTYYANSVNRPLQGERGMMGESTRSLLVLAITLTFGEIARLPTVQLLFEWENHRPLSSQIKPIISISRLSSTVILELSNLVRYLVLGDSPPHLAS